MDFFFQNQPIRIEYFEKDQLLIFKTFLSLFEKRLLKTLDFLRVTLKENGKNSIDFLIDKIDVELYFFHNFLDVYIVQNRFLRLSKRIIRETYSIKDFIFNFAYQRVKITAELHLTRKENYSF